MLRCVKGKKSCSHWIDSNEGLIPIYDTFYPEGIMYYFQLIPNGNKYLILQAVKA